MYEKKIALEGHTCTESHIWRLIRSLAEKIVKPGSVQFSEGRQPGIQQYLRMALRRGAQRVGVMEGQERNARIAILFGCTCHWRNLGLDIKGGTRPEARIRLK